MAHQTFFLNGLELEINVLSLTWSQAVIANIIFLIIFLFTGIAMPRLSFDKELVFIVFTLIPFAIGYYITQFIRVCQLVPLFTSMSVGLVIH